MAVHAARFFCIGRRLDGTDAVRDAGADGLSRRATTRKRDANRVRTFAGAEAIHVFPVAAFAAIDAIEDRVLEVAKTRVNRRRCHFVTDDFVESSGVLSQRDSFEFHATVSIRCAECYGLDRAKHRFCRANSCRFFIIGVRGFHCTQAMRTHAVRFRKRDGVGLFRVLSVWTTRFCELLFVRDVRDVLRSGNFGN